MENDRLRSENERLKAEVEDLRQWKHEQLACNGLAEDLVNESEARYEALREKVRELLNALDRVYCITVTDSGCLSRGAYGFQHATNLIQEMREAIGGE